MKDCVKKPLLVAMCFVFICIAAGCGANKEEVITSYDQLEEPGTVIALATDTPEGDLAKERFPEAEFKHYTNMQMAYPDVVNGRVDACIYARKEMELAMENGIEGVRLLDENFYENIVAVGLSAKSGIPDLQAKINQFIKELKDDGTLDDMYERWVINGDYTMPDIPEAKDPGFTLKVGTTGTVMPYSYYVGTELSGYDIELAKRFAAWLGADLEFKVFDFGGVVAAAQGGDVDCVMSNLYYTEEKAESMPFSDPLYTIDVTAMVKNPEGQSAGGGFFAGIADSFEKTFIREDRWKLFLQGIGVTMLITVLSIILGTLLGFAVFMACRKGNPVANRITRFYIWLVDGMPVVVLLMILYYIVFGSVQLSGTIVAIVCFTLIFGSAVYSMVKAGISAVDIGQLEASYTLGFTDRRAFYKIVLPQAMPMIMPAYKSQIKALIKATAVVGYIAVGDLTKMGDIVRSRTYDAFFPLVAVAIIYFILSALLTRIVNSIEPRFNPEKRDPQDFLKGVKTK